MRMFSARALYVLVGACAFSVGCNSASDATLTEPAVVPLLSNGSDVSTFAQTKDFLKSVTVEGVREHQAAFQQIADANGGTRASGSPGDAATVAYIRQRMLAAGYDVSVQSFDYPFVGDRTPPLLQQISPAITYVDGVDFKTMTNSGAADVTAPLVAVGLVIPAMVNQSTSGCEAADFAGFPAGSIALMQRGACDYRDKVINARNAGAVGHIIFNDGAPDRTGLIAGNLLTPALVHEAVVGTTFAVGNALRNGVLNGPTGVSVRLRTDYGTESRTAQNVIAETRSGDPDRVVVVGSSRGLAEYGPMINESSGAAAMVEIAETFAERERSPRNRVRFGWFAFGPADNLGAAEYVESLSAAEQARVSAMLAFDVLGSANGIRSLYDGDGSDGQIGAPVGSGAIEGLFSAYFATADLPVASSVGQLPGTYAPFAALGIPVGGLDAGTSTVKTPALAATFGGTPGVAFDPCFRLLCDSLANVNVTILDQLTDAAAHAVLLLSKRNFGKDPLAP
ncbi:MAG: PA domain-containing protein [Gemmatimonadota bacterium]